MARNGGSASSASPWTSESSEARRLADALRHCRLSVLCGEPDDARAGLIVTGLLPLLRRRAGDLAMLEPRDASSVIMPFPERRSQHRARLAELVVFNDALDDATPGGVHRAIDDALRLAGVVPERDTVDLADIGGLAQRVRALGDRHGTRMLFVFDRFDVVLNQRGPRTAPNVLLDQLGLVLSRRLPANVLISMRSQASALLEELRERGVTMDGELFELPSPEEDEQQEEDRPGAREETYADIVTFVERSRELGDTAVGTDDESEPDDRSDDSDPQRPSAEVVALTNEVASVVLRSQSGALASGPAVAAARTQAPPARDAHWPWAFAAAAVLAGAAVIVGLHNRLLPADSHVELPAPFGPAAALPADRPQSPSASRSESRSESRAAPPLEIAVESEGGEMPAPLAEFVSALSNTPNTAAKATPVSTLSPVSSPAPVSIVRYDALQATALRGGSKPISVIAPLYTEELYVVARADSSLRFIHQLRGKRINIGPANSARALTALELYERMFGRALPQARRNSLDAASALQRLAASRPTFDAIVLPQPEPSSLWNSLAPETRRELRLLRLDPKHPASQRALQEYLPATLHESVPSPAAPAPVQTIPTLAAMTFLVANGTPDAAQREAIVSLARALCEALPALKRSGHPKWREVRAGQQFETPWLPETTAAKAWSSCTDAGSLSPSSASSSQPVSQPFPQPRGAR